MNDSGQEFDTQIEQIPAGEKRQISGSHSAVHPDVARTLQDIENKFYIEEGIGAAQKFANRNLEKPHSSTKIEREIELPDRPPELDPIQNSELSNVLKELVERFENDPAAITFEDLGTIIEADRQDMLGREDSVNRIKASINVAKEYLQDPENIKKKMNTVNISLIQDEKGAWIAEPEAQKGDFYLTYTRSRIVDLRKPLRLYDLDIAYIGHVQKIFSKVISGESINDDEQNQIAEYLEGHKEGMEKAGMSATEEFELLDILKERIKSN